MKRLLKRLFCRWSKWELYKADQPYILTKRIVLTSELHEDHVMVDIYQRTHINGLKKYKRVIKYQ